MTNWADDWITLFPSDQSGSIRLAVVGKSMFPTLRPGDEAIVEPISPDRLCQGDLVVVRGRSGGFIHRYLGWWGGKIMTKGDGHRHLDPLWDPDRVVGRVVKVWRDSTCIYQWGRRGTGAAWFRAQWHRALGGLWYVLRALKGWIFALSLLCVFVLPVVAAVTLTDFSVEPGEQEIFVYWETASETGNLGFYVWRSEDAEEGYEKLPLDDPAKQFIPSEDAGVGAFYEYMDAEVAPGVVYYYKVQDVPDDGSQGEYSEVRSASIADEGATNTPTATPTPTPTATPTFTPQPEDTAVVSPQVRFWASETTLDAGDCTTLQWQTENVQSVFFDGEGVAGQGARTFCPCEDETHVLTVYLQGGGAEERTINLDTVGVCSSEDSPIATPSLDPSPTPSATSQAGVQTPTPSITPSPEPQTMPETPAVTPTRRSGQESDEGSVQSTPTLTAIPVSSDATSSETEPTPTPLFTATRVIVEGGPAHSRSAGSRALVLGVGALFGLVLVGGGAFLWMRSR